MLNQRKNQINSIFYLFIDLKEKIRHIGDLKN